jgi:signal transduction histidine kinase
MLDVSIVNAVSRAILLTPCLVREQAHTGTDCLFNLSEEYSHVQCWSNLYRERRQDYITHRAAGRRISPVSVAHPKQQLRGTDPGSIAAALHEALAEQRRELDAAAATVVEEDLDGLTAAVPAISLRQVFHNLVTNSLRFREPSRPLRVEVHARELGDLVEVAVTDNGTGIDERDRDHLFELFQRGTRRTTSPGHGIGLATCRKLVTRWGGSIRCESSSGPGARFVFTAPARVGASRPELV